MTRKRSRTAGLKAPIVVTVASVAGALPGCGANVADGNDDVSRNPPITEAPPIENPTSCPGDHPTAGASCSLEGTTCGYDLCGAAPTYTATCEGGTWAVSQRSCNPPPIRPEPLPEATECPADEPVAGTPCSSALVCDYGDCYGGPTATAECLNGSWEIGLWSCNPPPPSECPVEPPSSGDWCTGDVDCEWGEYCGDEGLIHAQCQADDSWLVWEELPGPDGCGNPPPPQLDASVEGGSDGSVDGGSEAGADGGVDGGDAGLL